MKKGSHAFSTIMSLNSNSEFPYRILESLLTFNPHCPFYIVIPLYVTKPFIASWSHLLEWKCPVHLPLFLSFQTVRFVFCQFGAEAMVFRCDAKIVVASKRLSTSLHFLLAYFFFFLLFYRFFPFLLVTFSRKWSSTWVRYQSHGCSPCTPLI